MRGDGVGDARILLLVERVIAAHHPLQLGELADHAAHEIGLGKNGGALGEVGVGADQRRDLPRQQAHALDALVLRCRASRGRRSPSASARGSGSITLRSWSKKNLASASRAAITRSLPATMALPPSFASRLATNMNRLASLSPFAEREAFLVRLHRGGEHLRRHRQKGLVERAHEHHRPFGKPGILGKQRLVLDQGKLLFLRAARGRLPE